jgi:hypothetical protein
MEMLMEIMTETTGEPNWVPLEIKIPGLFPCGLSEFLSTFPYIYIYIAH